MERFDGRAECPLSPHRRIHVLEEPVDGVRDLRDLRFDDADLTGRFPAADPILRCLPGHQIEAAPQILAAERSLNPDGAVAFLAPGIASTFTGMPARGQMASVDRERHAPIVPQSWYVIGTRKSLTSKTSMKSGLKRWWRRRESNANVA